MTLPPPTSNKPPRVVRILGLALAGILGFLALNTLQNVTANDSAAGLSTQSLLTIPGVQSEPSATAVPTTAPVQLPTATSVPATAVPAPTAAPTATPAPTPTTEATVAPQPTAAVAAAQSSEPPPPAAAAAEPQVQAAAPAEEPTAVVEPTAVPATATAVPAAPEPTPEPTSTERAFPAGIPEPPLSATATPQPEPTATPEPTAVPLRSVADLESYVLGEINNVRAGVGLGPLALDPTVSLISRDWSQQMAAGGFFEHRNGDELSALLPPGWRRWGENIASAPDIFWAQSSLEKSPGHYANMVSPNFTAVGIGVYQVNGQVWVTQNFVQY